MAQVLDAAGFEVILIETVGAGQSEVDIARLAHTTIVVEAPGMGDDIQAIKAGILEIADILVVNKADRPLADSTRRALQANLDLAHPAQLGIMGRMHHHTLVFEPLAISEPLIQQEAYWQPPILMTISTEGQGINPVVDAIMDHRNYLKSSGQWQAREATRLQEELNDLILERFAAQWRAGMDQEKLMSVVKSLLAREYSPLQAVEKLMSRASARARSA